MKVKPWLLPLLVLPLLATRARAQEGVRDLTGSGQHSKFLTQNQLDRWLFEGEKGETIIAHLASRLRSDPGAARTGGEGGQGSSRRWTTRSECRFAFRLPERASTRSRPRLQVPGRRELHARVQRLKPTRSPWASP